MKKSDILPALVAVSITLTTTNLSADDPYGKEAAPSTTPPQTGQNDKHQGLFKPAGIVPKDSCFKASYIIGREVQSDAGERLGKVQDLVLNLASSTTPFCIVAYGGTMGMGMTRVAVPFRELRWLPDSGVLAMAASKEKFQSAPTTPTGEWAAVASEDWAKNVNRYYGEPSAGAVSRFERQPAGEANEGAEPVRDSSQHKGASELLTPKPADEPSPSSRSTIAPIDADAKLTQQVNQLVYRDAGPNGSQNITTRLKDGVITLTGSVTSQSQKQLLEDHIRALPGVDRVDNQLTIKE